MEADRIPNEDGVSTVTLGPKAEVEWPVEEYLRNIAGFIAIQK
jgi:hypothetical protein